MFLSLLVEQVEDVMAVVVEQVDCVMLQDIQLYQEIHIL
jgi:hypothetical protein